MEFAIATKLPKKTLAKVNVPDNPAWTDDMLGALLLKCGRGQQAAPKKSSPRFIWMPTYLSSSRRRPMATSSGSTPYFAREWSRV